MYKNIIESFLLSFFDDVKIETKKETKEKETYYIEFNESNMYLTIDKTFNNVVIAVKTCFITVNEMEDIKHLKKLLVDVVTLVNRGLIYVK